MLESWNFVNVIGITSRTFTPIDDAKPIIPLSSLIPSWNGAQKFSMGFWAIRNSYSDTQFHEFVRLANTE